MKTMKTSKLLKILIPTVLFLTSTFCMADSLTLKGALKGGAGYTLALLNSDGSSATTVVAANGSFSFKGINSKNLKNSSLQIIDKDGRFYGPTVLGKKGTKVSINFSGKNPSGNKVLNLGKFQLKDSYALASKNLDKKIYTSPKVTADSSGKPDGAGNSGITVNSLERNNHQVKINEVSLPGQDSDRDGIVNSLDADDNGNRILDGADPESEGTDTPYVGLHFDFRKTLNANVRSGLSDQLIDAVVSGENIFTSTFFISLPDDSPIDGGYLVCGEGLSYCRPNTPVGYSSGVSESSSAYRGPLSSLLNSQGYPILERISVAGRPAIVLSLQPRVGRDEFRAGDVYRVVLTSSGRELSSRTFSLPPYFVSVPAIRDYTSNSTTTSVDYNSLTADSGSIQGVSPGDPITLGADGLLTLNFWRPQREPIGTESSYQDFGGLKYGVVIENLQATCGGLYSRVSGDLSEVSNPLGQGNSPLANQGANLYPLEDQTADRAVASTSILSLTVDLKTCLSRASGTPGTYAVDLTAAGPQLTGGQNATSQVFYVNIP